MPAAQTKKEELNAQLTNLRRELSVTRQQSLAATRRGDFMQVARLTAAAARLNKSVMELEGLIIDADLQEKREQG